MKKPIHMMVIIILLLLTIFLYNRRLASIPLILLSFYLFSLAGVKLSLFKKNK
ncbi:hypothetical protein [Bacillus sp. FJAT-22090]|uniref:hypothetical protein n=1 Tax=Bacillus sp. FJAT-22090 TaxID=1581038 RepID=UPI001642A00E|nr:hypothetical protein [Bacillus sp. FJAT-22090]